MTANSFSHLFSRTPVLNNPNLKELRQEVRDYFDSTFLCYERLFDTLACDAAYYQKAISLRHPLIFYFGHTATFFINKLILARLIDQRINPRFESLFAVGVDEMSWDDLNEAHYDWPSVAEVRDYRRTVRQRVLQLIDTLTLSGPIDWQSPWWAILMGIEHERIHLETSSVLIRQQRLEWLKPQAQWPICHNDTTPPENHLVSVPATHVQLGKAWDSPHYGWDNEYGTHSADVAAFEASQYLVSNHEFLAFVKADGYLNSAYWCEEGWRWREFSQATHPTFWLPHGDSFQLRTMTEVIDMPWSWPAEVNCLEAMAFCRWLAATTGKPIQLPSEDQWHALALASGVAGVPSRSPTAANIHLDHYASPCPVNQFKHGDFYDVIGNVWQWTQTPTYPFDGFQVHPLYDDFTTPTFDDRHNLIMGGSWISCGNETQRSARYAFRRHFFQHAGFRYVSSHERTMTTSPYYETDKQLTEYAEFHYGDSYFGVSNFPQAVAHHALRLCQNRPMRRALDLGCATGRTSFALATHFEHVDGVDFSARFIQLATQMAEQGQIRYTLADEGELISYKQRTLAELNLAETSAHVHFSQGDACNLKPLLTGYDLIVAANLIDRLYDPARFLKHIHERLLVGGVLVITSPYTWLTEHTPREAWLGGFKKDGENYDTLLALRECLAEHFELLEEPMDVPFVIRETRRKFQHTLSQLTAWVRVR